MGLWNNILGGNGDGSKELRKVTDDVKNSLDRIDSAIYMSKSIINYYSVEAKRYTLERDNNFKEAMKHKETGNAEQAKRYISNSVKNDKIAKSVFAKINKYKNYIDFKMIPLKGRLRETRILVEHAARYKQNPSSLLAEVITNAIGIVEKTEESMVDSDYNLNLLMNRHTDKEEARMEIEKNTSYEDVEDVVEENNTMEDIIKGYSQEMKDKYNNYVKSSEVETVAPDQL